MQILTIKILELLYISSSYFLYLYNYYINFNIFNLKLKYIYILNFCMNINFQIAK